MNGYFNVTIIYRDFHEREDKVIANMLEILKKVYLEAGYRDIETTWTVDANLTEYIINITW